MSKSISPKSLDTSLKSLLEEVGSGKLQLPAFQRGWRWDEERIRRLLASLTLGYPMGAVMLLEYGGEAKFGTHLFEGVRIRKPKPDRLVLDGQQRLTSLWRAMCSKDPVLMPDENAKDPGAGFFFYLDIAACLDESTDRLDAVVAVPGSRVLKHFRENGAILDLSTQEKEHEAGMFPVNLVFDAVPWFMDWIRQDGYAHAQEREKIYNAFSTEILAPVAVYTLPAVTLARETPKEAVCQVFENVNTGGVSLTVFELEAASFAAEDDSFDLRADWEKDVRPAIRGQGEPLVTDVMHAVDERSFLTVVALLVSHDKNATRVVEGRTAIGSSCKKKDILGLSLDDYRKYKNRAKDGFNLARNFLIEQSVFRKRDLPYTSQLIPLAAICADVGKSVLEHPAAAAVLARWYWCGVLGEMYNGPVETSWANDMDDVSTALKAAAAGEKGPFLIRTTDAAFFSAPRLLTMRTRNSAAYKGLMAQIYLHGGLDFRKGVSMNAVLAMKNAPDIHHIFPKKWCLEFGNEYAKANLDSIVNKTPLLPASNVAIGGAAPSAYARKIMKEAGIGEEELRKRVESHLVDWEAFMTDDFHAHFIFRAKKLLNLVEKSMGKKVADRGSAQTIERFGASLEDNGQEPINLSTGCTREVLDKGTPAECWEPDGFRKDAEPSLEILMETVLLGLATGDALGGPAEGRKRGTFRITDMKGSDQHGQPAGTWSGETSLALAFADSLRFYKGDPKEEGTSPTFFSPKDAGRNFRDWFYRGKYTARGKSFNTGKTTRMAIDRMERGVPPEDAGGHDESDSGKGSLVRCAPLAVAILKTGDDLALREAVSYEASRLTHAHPLPASCCFLFVEFLRLLCLGMDRVAAYEEICAIYGPGCPGNDLVGSSTERARLRRVLYGNLMAVPEKEIKSDGSAVHTLETALWCVLTSKSCAEAMLKAVNLGNNASTTGAATGACAALCWGRGSIPAKWMECLASRDEILRIARKAAQQI